MSRLVRVASLVNVVGVFFFYPFFVVVGSLNPCPCLLLLCCLLFLFFFCSLSEKGRVGVAVMLMLFRLGRFAGSHSFYRAPRVMPAVEQRGRVQGVQRGATRLCQHGRPDARRPQRGQEGGDLAGRDPRARVAQAQVHLMMPRLAACLD